MGCGMGGSAATIISILHACQQIAATKISAEQLFQIALSAEHMQHGRSSGLDLALSLHGGIRRFQQGQHKPLQLPSYHFQLAHTGIPAATTGECVVHTSNYLQDKKLLQQFAATTETIYSALSNNQTNDLKQAVQTNHRLLCQIGVAPIHVQNFIKDLEKQNMAGKICGAGSIRGDKAGIVWIIGDNDSIIRSLIADYNYQYLQIEQESYGATIL